MIDPKMLGLSVVSTSGDEAYVHCPFHADDHASASFNMRKGVFICFGCHERANAKKLARHLGGSVTNVDVVRHKRKADIEWRQFLLAPLYTSRPNGYLDERGVTNEEADEYEIRVTPLWLVFISRTQQGNPTGVILRSLTSDGPRYMKLGNVMPLWPYHLLTQQMHKGITLTEGVFGAIRARRAGLNAFATVGTTINEPVIHSISPWVKYIFFDDDFPGYKAAVKVMSMCASANAVVPGADVDSLGADEIKRMIRHSTHSLLTVQKRMKMAKIKFDARRSHDIAEMYRR